MNTAYFKTMSALIRREVIEGKFFYIWLPIILMGITAVFVVFALFGWGQVHIGSDDFYLGGPTSFADFLNMIAEKDPEELPLKIAVAYGVLTGLPWLAIPFVMFFTLTSTLFDERKDRSILFWKSMPVSDMQEVVARLVSIAIVYPAFALAFAIVFQLGYAVLFTLFALVGGADVGMLWPLGQMTDMWIANFLSLPLFVLWALPVFAWIVLASAYAPRVPFVYAVLPVGLLIAVESWFFKSNAVASWLADHLGRGFFAAMDFGRHHIDGPSELMETINLEHIMAGYGNSLITANFWLGLIVGAVFLFGAIELRRQAN